VAATSVLCLWSLSFFHLKYLIKEAISTLAYVLEATTRILI